MIRIITNQPSQAARAKLAKPKRYFTLKKTLLYFPTKNVVRYKRVDILFDDTEKIISFQPKKDGKCCITTSKGRAHIGLAHSKDLRVLRNKMPHGAYTPLEWHDVPADILKQSTRNRDQVFRFDPDLTSKLSTPNVFAQVKRKRRVSRKTKRNISRSLKAHHRGRRSALRKR